MQFTQSKIKQAYSNFCYMTGHKNLYKPCVRIKQGKAYYYVQKVCKCNNIQDKWQILTRNEVNKMIGFKLLKEF